MKYRCPSLVSVSNASVQTWTTFGPLASDTYNLSFHPDISKEKDSPAKEIKCSRDSFLIREGQLFPAQRDSHKCNTPLSETKHLSNISMI